MSFIPRRDWICVLAIGDIYGEAAAGVFLAVVVKRLFLAVDEHDHAIGAAEVEFVRGAVGGQFDFFAGLDEF